MERDLSLENAEENENLFSIGRVAALLELPAATIRFWEDAGLFSVPKAQNSYRTYAPRNLAEIADIKFLRNSGVPVKAIPQLRRSDLTGYREALCLMEARMQEELMRCKQTCDRIKRQITRLEEVRRLQDIGFVREEVPFERIFRFDFQEKEKLLRYSTDPSLYVRYYNTQDIGQETRCIILPSAIDGTAPHWEKKKDSVFLTFLIRERAEHAYESDVLSSLQQVQKEHRTGVLLARYLLTAAENNELIDYLKGYVEIL